uniref:Uncharacterized protein n=1 Tax=Tanacetum cinerariifolium TaxID=118510 RepID=A0A6L2LT90_TANCI|nr:hypothetical protein [Tanacetum cinerariifolium]
MHDLDITIEEYIRHEEEKARRRGKVFNCETAKYAIIYNDAPTYKSDLLTEPTLSPHHIDKFDLKDETSLFECDEEEWNDAHHGYNFPPKVSIISNPKPCHNQNADVFPQTLPSFHLTCYSGDENSFAYDSPPNFVNDSPNVFNPPSQPLMYSYEFCGNDAQYGHDCPPQFVIDHLNPQQRINDSMIELRGTFQAWLQQRKDQVFNLDSYSPKPLQCRKIPLCYDDDDDERSSTPLREIIIFELPPFDDDFSSSDNESFSDEDFSKEIYSNPLFDEEIISIKIDPHHFSAEFDLIESLLNQDSVIISSSKIDSLLNEFVGIDSDNSDSEGDNLFPERLLHDDPIPLSDILDSSNVDPGENSSQCPLQIERQCCYGCGDSLDGIFCQRCSYMSCRNDARYGYNCPQKVPIISNPKPCHNQNVDEFPQTLLSFHPTCYSGYENSFAYDSTPNFVNDSPNVFNLPSQPLMYSYEFCGNDAQYGHDCPPQFVIDHLNHQQRINDSMIELRGTFQAWLQQQKDQVVNLDSYSPKPLQCQKIPLCYDDDDGERSSTPLREIVIFKLPPCFAITPVLSTKETKDSLIIGDEHLDTIPEKESD